MSVDRHGFRTKAYAELLTRTEKVLGTSAKALAPLGIETLYDLLRHTPRTYYLGSELSDLAELRVGEQVSLKARVLSSEVKKASKPRLQVVIGDDAGHRLAVTFFGRYQKMVEHWARLLQPGADGFFVGKVGVFARNLQLTNPAFVVRQPDGSFDGSATSQAIVGASVGELMPIYPATVKHPTWLISADVKMALDHLAGLGDPLPVGLRERAGVVELMGAFHDVHRPSERAEIGRGMRRLLFDEVFALQLAMARRRAESAATTAIPRPRVAGGLLDRFDARLPYTLTAGQQQVGTEILDDLARPHPMQRLLQGEVGSGKTVVALRAMLTVVDNGGQAALLAPTEVLAQQHYQTLRSLLGDLVRTGGLADAGLFAESGLFAETGDAPSTGLALLTGSLPAKRKQQLRDRLAAGEIGLVIGTHALLTEGTRFADLGLVVVDEQHRFGVEQRAALTDRAAARPHLLAMTATPIPRSVAITLFGDLEVSTLTELPAGRPDVGTVVVHTPSQPAWVDRAWLRIREEVAAGHQAFVVCARIDPADTDPGPVDPGTGDASTEGLPPALGAVELFEQLTRAELAGLRVGLLHGRLKAEEKDATMAAFAAGSLDVLVATTVIEVGVDVPNATIMVIHDADRFGVSQLHQLRGRIGRGTDPGVCLLFTTAAPDSPAGERLAAVAKTRDGFELAELDLAQRREGDILGSAQAGSRSSLRFLRVLEHRDMIDLAHHLAADALAADPELTDPGLSDMVRLVEQDAAGEWLERA